MKIYFAGPPCMSGDWRHEIIPNLHLDPNYFRADPEAPWPTRSKAVQYNVKSAYADYVGPYPMSQMPKHVFEREDLLQALAIAQATTPRSAGRIPVLNVSGCAGPTGTLPGTATLRASIR